MMILSRLALLGCAIASLAAADLLPNGDFADGDGDGKPDGWSIPAGAVWDPAGFVRFTADGAATVQCYRAVPVTGAGTVTVRCRLRSQDVKRGSEGWHDARIIINLKDANGAKVQPQPKPIVVTGTSDWVEREVDVTLPSEAVTLELLFGVFQASAGTFDVDRIAVVTDGA